MAEGVFCEKAFEMNPNSIGVTNGNIATLSDRIGLTFSFFDFAKVQLFFGLTPISAMEPTLIYVATNNDFLPIQKLYVFLQFKMVA